MKTILLVTDNDELLTRFRKLVQEKGIAKATGYSFHYAFSRNNDAFSKVYRNSDWIRPVGIKDELPGLIDRYQIIFSMHCKQIFPAELCRRVKCINIHPGLNPYNRGWFPQVFSIINGLPCGATIHEIDEQLDHGGIICQKAVKLETWDTSLSAYKKILDAEIELLSENFENILRGQYTTTIPEEGNLNLKGDFDRLCKIDLDDTDTFQNHINKLRALTHGDYKNAHFFDGEGNRIYLKLELSKDPAPSVD